MSVHIVDPYQTRLLWGNSLLVICCIFYLAWWRLAFRPRNPYKGLGTKILLLLAVAAGIAAVAFMAQGISSAPHAASLFPAHSILWGGIAAYLILLAVSYFVFRRQVTTELFLIVGWAMLEFSVLDVLFSSGRFGLKASILLIIIIGIVVLISLVCYLLYYRLKPEAGYVGGMIPLIAAAVAAAAVAAATVI